MRRVAVLATALLAITAGGVLYAEHGARSNEAKAPAPPPAVPVAVRTLKPQPIQLWSDFSGRLRAVDFAEIRPEVAGRITEVRFEDGQQVRAGDIVFVIDPRPYEAAVARAQANLATATTNAGFAKLELDRAQGLIRTQAIAQRQFDERANSSRVANAAIDAAKAELKQASLDLEHAYVRAPIAGRLSRAELTVGNLVQTGAAAPLLTTIVGNHTIYADFDVDEQTYIAALRLHPAGREDERRIPVALALPGDEGRSYSGTIYTFDNRLDVQSGTIRARAKFDNHDGALVPGMFVTVRLAASGEREALLLPNRAIGFDQSKKFVYVVGSDNKVAYRAVELGSEVGAERVVLKGVAAGERVIVDGLQHVRPDATVAPSEATPGAVAAAASR